MVYRYVVIFFVLLFNSILFCFEDYENINDIPEYLEIIPDNDIAYKVIDIFYHKKLFKDNKYYKKGMILTRRDAALLLVMFVVKLDEIKDMGIDYYLTFYDLKLLLMAINKYAEEIQAFFPDKIDLISKKIYRIERILNVEAKSGKPS